jgi:hypothetical protein
VGFQLAGGTETSQFALAYIVSPSQAVPVDGISQALRLLLQIVAFRSVETDTQLFSPLKKSTVERGVPLNRCVRRSAFDGVCKAPQVKHLQR